MARGGNQPLSNFLTGLRLPKGFDKRGDASGSAKVAAAIEWMQTKRPQRQNHWPALVLALIAQAEELLAAEGLSSVTNVFTTYPPEKEKADGKSVHTLNFTRDGGDPILLRPTYNAVLDIIFNEMLREHPTNPPYATRSWTAHAALIEMIFEMTPAERRAFAEWVWQKGVLDKPEIVRATVRERVVRPFEFVLLYMPTADLKIAGMRGGAMLQGITFGYFLADSPNLILESRNVNTGSSRAGLIGDVDGYRGGEVELAAEVKDLHVADAETVSEFIEDLAKAPNATAVVICRSVSDEARSEIESHNVTVLTVPELARTVSVWDLPKQQEGLRGVDYYLGRIQKSTKGQEFFRNWLIEHNLDAGFPWIEETEQDAEASVASGNSEDGTTVEETSESN